MCSISNTNEGRRRNNHRKFLSTPSTANFAPAPSISRSVQAACPPALSLWLSSPPLQYRLVQAACPPALLCSVTALQEHSSSGAVNRESCVKAITGSTHRSSQYAMPSQLSSTLPAISTTLVVLCVVALGLCANVPSQQRTSCQLRRVVVGTCVWRCEILSLRTGQALVDLYTATNGAKWKLNTNWLNGDPCSQKWYGVTCSSNNPITGLYVHHTQ